MMKELEKCVCGDQVPLHLCLDLRMNSGPLERSSILKLLQLLFGGHMKSWTIATAFLLHAISPSLTRRILDTQSRRAQFLQISVK